MMCSIFNPCEGCGQIECNCVICRVCEEKGSDCTCGDLEDYYDAMRERKLEEEWDRKDYESGEGFPTDTLEGNF